MDIKKFDRIFDKHVAAGNHAASDYFALIKELLAGRNRHPEASAEFGQWQDAINQAYALLDDEIATNDEPPISPVSFGTSGWRGILGKDLFVKSVAQVTEAIVSLYADGAEPELSGLLGTKSFQDACRRGVVVGHDNRFGGAALAKAVTDVLTCHGFTVYDVGEATTGTISATVITTGAAFSVNLTPSHNPLEYAGLKFNAADAGPAPSELTDRITQKARAIMTKADVTVCPTPKADLVRKTDALESWTTLVRRSSKLHGLDYDRTVSAFHNDEEFVIAIDCVHGATRTQIRKLLNDPETNRLILLRATNDPTFGGVTPEPSTENMRFVKDILAAREEPLKLGIIMDPDGDRIRFTDGKTELSMNHFGGMAYHFLHEALGKHGMVAKTVATSNFANAVARKLKEEIFETRVGFKEFKPVIDKALVCFEESDGITVIGHTPEKDAYIGMLVAMSMILFYRKNLGDILAGLQQTYGAFFPAKDGVRVSCRGKELAERLSRLKRYQPGMSIPVGGVPKKISSVIDIDGYKVVFDDGGWLMIRASGTEPKVRFYVESRSLEETDGLFQAARSLLAEIELLA